SEIANRVTFTLTNGNSANQHFLASEPSVMRYSMEISEFADFHVRHTLNFTITSPPLGNGTSENYEHNFFLPNTYSPGTYYIRMFAVKSNPNGFVKYSNNTTIDLYYDVSV